jgi:hypothetical protein
MTVLRNDQKAGETISFGMQDLAFSRRSPGHPHDRELQNPQAKQHPQDGRVPRMLLSRKEAAYALNMSLRALDYVIAAKQVAVRHHGSRVLIPYVELVRLSRMDLPSISLRA